MNDPPPGEIVNCGAIYMRWNFDDPGNGATFKPGRTRKTDRIIAASALPVIVHIGQVTIPARCLDDPVCEQTDHNAGD